MQNTFLHNAFFGWRDAPLNISSADEYAAFPAALALEVDEV